jgi:Fe-S-cluster containining protein
MNAESRTPNADKGFLMSTSPPDPPWYAPGLSFSCTQCGNCCTGAPGYVWVSESELRAIAEFRGVSYGEVRYQDARKVGHAISLNEHANGDCVYFDGKTRRCTIYPVRPVQCQTWPFWNSNLESPADWKFVQTTCPGAGHGEFVPLERIREQASQFDV